MRRHWFPILVGIWLLSGCRTHVGPEGLLAYSRLTDGSWQIWVANLDGKKPAVVTTSVVDKRHPVWLEPGKTIIYRTNNGELYTLDIESKKEQRILEKFGQIGDPDWSSTADLLAFTRYSPNLTDESEIWTVRLDGSGQKVVTNSPGMQYHPVFSPDGQKIVYVSGASFGTHEIWIMDRKGENQRRLIRNEGGYDIFPKWSPDGKSIAFASDRSGNFDVWVVDAEGTNPEKLTEYEGLDTYPAWSPDGKGIFFVSNRSGGLQICNVNRDSGRASQVTFAPGESNSPACTRISPDE